MPGLDPGIPATPESAEIAGSSPAMTTRGVVRRTTNLSSGGLILTPVGLDPALCSSNCAIGLLMNFNCIPLKDGLHRVVA
jgi:hypothetical protein